MLNKTITSNKQILEVIFLIVMIMVK